jgi:hypothetical protein
LFIISQQYWIKFSFDSGINFSENINSIQINSGGICQAGYYCPVYKQIPVLKVFSKLKLGKLL